MHEPLASAALDRDTSRSDGPGRGWRDAGVDLSALQRRLNTLRPGLQVQVAEEVDSTNTRLLEAARSGDTTPRLLAAERQTAGRGRLGRTWWSDTSAAAKALGPASLTFSIGLPLAPRGAGGWSGLSLAVGVALAEALDERVRLKWPNDLWLQDDRAEPGRKLGGILIETVALPDAPDHAGDGDAPTRYAVIGVGLNLDTPDAQAGIGQPVAGWREVQPDAHAASVLERVAPAVLQALQQFEQDGFAAFTARFAARDALAGRSIHTLGAMPLHGTALGVDERGALRLLTSEGTRLIDSGEVSRHEEPQADMATARTSSDANPSAHPTANLSVRPC